VVDGRSKAVPRDPWGKPYAFIMPGEHGEYDLLSYGKDGRPGGEGEAAEITSWQVGNATVIKRIGATSHPMRGRHHAL